MFLFEKVLKSEGGVIAILDPHFFRNFHEFLDKRIFCFENVSKMCLGGYQEYVFCIFDPLGVVSEGQIRIWGFWRSFFAGPRVQSPNLDGII